MEGVSVSEEARGKSCGELCARDSSTEPWLLVSIPRGDSSSEGRPRLSAES